MTMLDLFSFYNHDVKMIRSYHNHIILTILLIIFSHQVSLATKLNIGAIDHHKEYKSCLSLAISDAKSALDAASYWQQQGGDIGAMHCQASALATLARYGEAATLLEEIVNNNANILPIAKAEFLYQAAKAHSLNGDHKRAIGLMSAARALNNNNIDYLAELGILNVLAKDYVIALDHLNKTLNTRPSHIRALLFRSMTHRALGNDDESERDLSLALQLEPHNPSLLLEQGLRYAKAGRNDQAKTTWEKVIQLSNDEQLATIAHDNIQKLTANKPLVSD
jgi:tetratricopeptide (TPR) repeat protein